MKSRARAWAGVCVPGDLQVRMMAYAEAEVDTTKYSPELDLATIPDDVLYAELARREAAKGGRKRQTRLCAKCGREVSARALRLECPHGLLGTLPSHE